MKNCTICGTALPDEARFCLGCGARQDGGAPSVPPPGTAFGMASGMASGTAASMNAALDAAAAMGAAMERGGGMPEPGRTAVLTPPAAGRTAVLTPPAPPAPQSAAPPAAGRAVPLYDRGPLSRKEPAWRRVLVNVLLVIGLVVLQVGLILFFSGFSDGEDENMLTAQIVGIVPVVLLLLYIFFLDTIEKEPIGLLAKLFILEGAFGMTVVVLVELLLDEFFAGLFGEYAFTLAYRFFDAVFLVALVEELGKYLILRWCTWKHKAFNYRFDGIVYAAVTALGFAAFENMGYVASFGLSTALMRAVSAVPGHCVDGILMGIFYGQAKCYAARGDAGKARLYRFLSVAVPVAEHGFYDFVAGIQGELVSTLFLFYVWLLNAVVFVAVWRQSQKDEAVAGTV